MSDQTGRTSAVNPGTGQTSRSQVAGGTTSIEPQRLEALGLLAPGVALEFGNLMTIVLGSMEQLGRQPLDGQGREQLQRAESGARQVARLIRQALSLSLPHHEDSTDQLVELNEAVRDFDKMLALIAGENVKVALELSPQPLLARLEVTQLKLALLDILRSGSSAISGNGLIVIRTSANEADCFGGDRPVVELSATVTAAAPITATQEPGSGPGMDFVAAKRFVSLCRGKMMVEAAPGGGMTVRLVFPGPASDIL